MRRYGFLVLLAAILALPVITAWNLTIGAQRPWWALHAGAPLAGAVADTRSDVSIDAVVTRRLQRAVEARVTYALPIREFLVRLNNQLRLSLFGELNGLLVQGANGALVSSDYVDEYCSRRTDSASRNAEWAIPRLRDIQAFYRSRGAVFLYVISPSKVAHSPEDFVDDERCPGPPTRGDQTRQYAERLREAGIAVVDTASFIHGLKTQYDFDLFPRGGVHWNSLGATRATALLVDAIDEQAGAELVPPLRFEYAMAPHPVGTDRDLADLSNVLFPALDYPTTRVTYQPPPACGTPVKAAVIGGSFMHMPVEILTQHACLPDLQLYFYMKAIFGGVPHQRQRSIGDADLTALLDMKIVVLEENEGAMADRVGLEAEQVERLHQLITRR